MEELKTRSIRADAETLEKFRILSEEFENQGECLKNLVAAYELSNAKHILTDVSTDIADYESHINSIQSAFLHLLELNSNTECRIRQEFKELLESKDRTISDLQTQLEQAKTEKENAISSKKEDTEQIQQLEKQLADATEQKAIATKTANDKQKLIDNLLLQVADIETIKADTKNKVDEIQSLKATVTDKEKIISDLNNVISENKTAIDNLNKDIEHNNVMHKQALEVAEQQKKAEVSSAIAETKSSYIDKIELLRDEKEKLKDRIRELEKLVPISESTPTESISSDTPHATILR